MAEPVTLAAGTAIGTPDVPPVTPNPPVFGDERIPARVWAKIRVDAESGCWVWTACLSYKGYGQVHWEGGTRAAHRVIFAALVGPIPPGRLLDHRCRNRACVNPWHLDVVTSRTNTLRGNGISAINARKTHCTRGGHPLAGVNLRVRRDGRRQCRTCERDNGARWRARRRAETDEPSTTAKIIGNIPRNPGTSKGAQHAA